METEMMESKQQYLKSKYKLEKRLARGGMSSVYLCTNTELGNQWVAKHIDYSYADFLYEEEILKKLNHISLPKIIDVCREDTGIYIIESYIEGISLQKKLENVGALPPEKVIDYCLQLCEVLQYLHNMKPKAIVHKDIKPSNILVTEYDKLVLIDFGISQMQGCQERGVRAGTGAYASPEQLAAAGYGDTRWDIYSLGVVLHEMLTGQLPGSRDCSQKKPSFIYEKLLEISNKCSRVAAKDRYQRIEELKEELLKLRNKHISNSENYKIKRKMVLILIGILSMINYICLFIGLILFKG